MMNKEQALHGVQHVSFSQQEEALSALMLCVQWPSAAIFNISHENGKLQVFSCFVHFLMKKIEIYLEMYIQYDK